MTKSQLLKRKSIRLKHYDYSQQGSYFITICIENRRKILSNIIGDDLKVYPEVKITDIGAEIEKSLIYLPSISNGVSIEQYVIMPNHIHFIISIDRASEKLQLQDIVGRFKSYTTHRYNQLNNTKGTAIWQRSFHEHVIRSESELLEISEYIENNPLKWREDRYYEE